MEAKTILDEAKALESEIICNRHYLHAHPETGFDLTETKEYVRRALVSMGYEPMDCGKKGLVALCGGKNPGKVFMLRADMDALPIREESGVEFASDSGRMHACGHDLHTSMLLGAAKILKNHENELQGTIKLMFQPAEEIFEGSHDMISAGLLEDPHVDAALMIHVMANMPFTPGTVVVSSAGVSAPAADYFKIRVQGKGCHGSMPNNGVDPINAAAHILLAIQEIQTRELSVNDKAVITMGTFNAGGADNAIADMAVMGGTIRTYDEEVRQFIKERMQQVAENTASAFRATATVEFGSGCPTLKNDKDTAESAEKYVHELLGDAKAFSSAQLMAMGGGASKSAGSEDFAYVSQKVPSVMLALAAGQPDKGYCYPQHHPKVKFDESALWQGAAVYAYNGIRWLEDHR